MDNIKSAILNVPIAANVKSAEEWASADILNKNEIGYDKTNKIYKIGDGVTAWAGLEEWGGGSGGGGDFVPLSATNTIKLGSGSLNGNPTDINNSYVNTNGSFTYGNYLHNSLVTFKPSSSGQLTFSQIESSIIMGEGSAAGSKLEYSIINSKDITHVGHICQSIITGENHSIICSGSGDPGMNGNVITGHGHTLTSDQIDFNCISGQNNSFEATGHSMFQSNLISGRENKVFGGAFCCDIGGYSNELTARSAGSIEDQVFVRGVGNIIDLSQIGFQGRAMSVLGRYSNVTKPAALVIGNGYYGDPSNALELDWDGNLEVAGKVVADSFEKSDGTPIGGDSSINYSTEETAIGTWIDGKTIYRKVFTGGGHTTIYSDSWTGTGISTVDMERILKIDALCQYNSHPAVSGQIGYNTLQLKATNANNLLLEYVILEYIKN